MPSECDIPIHTFSNFTKVSRFVSSLDHQYLSIIAYLQYLQFCDNLDRLPKKVAQPTATALHRPPPICSERKYVISKPEPEPETRVWPFPNPKTRVYKSNPGLETLTSTQASSMKSVSLTFTSFHCTRLNFNEYFRHPNSTLLRGVMCYNWHFIQCSKCPPFTSN